MKRVDIIIVKSEDWKKAMKVLEDAEIEVLIQNVRVL